MRGASQAILNMIKHDEMVVKRDDDLFTIYPGTLMSAYDRNAYGMYIPKIPTTLFLFDITPQDSVDYVLTHEFMHSVSHRLNNEVYSKIDSSGILTNYSNLTRLVIEEEYRADSSALTILKGLNQPIPGWVSRRFEHYDKHVSTDVRQSLQADIDNMISFATSRLKA